MRLEKPNYKKVIILFLIFSIAVLTLNAGNTIAKYSVRKEASVEASKLSAYHISSDLADLPDGEGNPVSSVSWYSGIYENGIRIRLYNYEKDNVALISEADITYSVSAEAVNAECSDTYTVTVQNSSGARSRVRTENMFFLR